jgi:hypothetical protein
VISGDLTLYPGRSADEIRPGQAVTVEMTIENKGDESVLYSGGCGRIGDIWIDLPAGVSIEDGAQWQGAAGRMKDLVVAIPEGIALENETKPQQGCDATGRSTELAPGSSISQQVSWDGRFSNGYPVPEGLYPIHMRFIGSVDEGDVVLEASLPVKVNRADPVLTPGLAMDIILADDRTSDWINEHPADTWSRAELKHHLEGTYRLNIYAANGESEVLSLVADVDGRTGSVDVDVDPD